MIRHKAGSSIWRFVTSNACIRLASSTSPSPQEFNSSSLKDVEKGSKSEGSSKTSVAGKNGKIEKQSLVSAAFRSLQSKESSVEELLQSANNVEEVLLVTKVPRFSQYHALQALSILAEWTTKKKIQMNAFESDPRFIQLCKMINPKEKEETDDRTNLKDLAVVLGVTGEDQAAKLIEGISFEQKIRVLSSLASKKRRSLHLLRALSADLCCCHEKFDLKQAADVLYAMAVLNFADSALMRKVIADINELLPKNNRPAVVGSILTSIGILKYRNPALLDLLCEWVRNNITVCREQDIVALLLTLASVSYQPNDASKLYKVILSNISDMHLRPLVWLDVVWALCILNVVETDHLQSVLVPEFTEKLTHTGYLINIPAPARLKLLNVNAVAQVIKKYPGPLLTQTQDLQFPLRRSREKQILVDSVMDSLTNLLPTPTYLRTDVDTGHGFLIDGECILDAKCNPLPVNSSSTKSQNKRIAVLVCDYHDMCRDSEELTGPVTLQVQILKQLGYKVMTVTHLDFKLKDKLVSKVKILEQKLKKIASI